MKILLVTNALVEALAGFVFAVFPSTFIHLGEWLRKPEGVVGVRMFGLAAFAIGLACWLARNGSGSFAAPALIMVLLVYDLVFITILLASRFEVNLSGLLPQQAHEKVRGQLIDAQEQERARIARDLHDDICQRLALLSMELEHTSRSSNQLPVPTRVSLEDIRTHCAEIAGDVQALSHKLHSSKLDYLGVVAAVRSFCQEFSKQHEVAIEFITNGVPQQLPKDISLCLFRVAQEALHNAVKYSSVGQFAVELTAADDQIRLVVSDSGVGFDVQEATQSCGLGLISMQERVNLVRGSLSIESRPGLGTRIGAVIPLAPSTWSPLVPSPTGKIVRVAKVA